METFRKIRNDKPEEDRELSKRSLERFTSQNNSHTHETLIIKPRVAQGADGFSAGVAEMEQRQRLSLQYYHYLTALSHANEINSLCDFSRGMDSQQQVSRSRPAQFNKTNIVELGGVEGLQPIAKGGSRSIRSEEDRSFPTMFKRVKQRSYDIQNTSSYFLNSNGQQSVRSSELAGPEPKPDSRQNIDNVDRYNLQRFEILNYSKSLAFDSLGVFSAAFLVLRALFKNSVMVGDIGRLSEESFVLFSVICEKKFKVRVENPKDTTGINQLIEVVKEQVVDKRPEECKKIVLSYSIKHLKYQLREKYSQQYRKNSFEEFFYAYYFEEISKAEGIPLADFYYPIASTKCKKNSAKTINKTYLQNIGKSQLFMESLRDYIANGFVKDYSREIDNKLMDLINRWEESYTKRESITLLKESLEDYFKDSKSKLPWTIYEIQYAMGKVKKALA